VVAVSLKKKFLDVANPVIHDALCRFHLMVNEIILEELGHNAGAFARIDLQSLPQIAL
jgi:hypothetical protein